MSAVHPSFWLPRRPLSSGVGVNRGKHFSPPPNQGVDYAIVHRIRTGTARKKPGGTTGACFGFQAERSRARIPQCDCGFPA